jgi:hypothetical protein
MVCGNICQTAMIMGSSFLWCSLSQVNQDLGTEDWQITCLKFAPNAPEQDPVEDIWLQTKNFARKFRHICHSFKWVKWLFEFFADGQVFEFPKIHEYGLFTQPV